MYPIVSCISGIAYPSYTNQVALMKEMYLDTGIDTNDIAYVECHGTGTPAGDPIEVRALAEVFCKADRKEPLLIGSAKSNMGHSESVSGRRNDTSCCCFLFCGDCSQ